MMREITSSPRAICPLYSATCALTCPLIRSTSQKVTVVVPMSIATPQSGESSVVAGLQIDQARGRLLAVAWLRV